jgi:hypothetical protein
VTAATSTVPGTDMPGALWRASTAAVTHEDCSRCGARPGQPCDIPTWMHLCRAIAAFLDGHLQDPADIAAVIRYAVPTPDAGLVFPALDPS